jgi:uncharacterized protein
MQRMRQLIALLLFLALGASAQQNPGFREYPISAVSTNDVVLHDDFWLPKIRLIQDTTIRYAFGKCSEEGRMDNFLVAGGKKAGAYKGKMPFDDTDPYKIIEGASYSLISKPNPALDAYLDSIIAVIKIGQEPDGYITTWFTINRQKPPASWVRSAKDRWENEVSSHELYNSGHLFEAAAAHYWATGKRTMLDIAIKNADLLTAHFGPGGLHKPPGHQIVETGLMKLTLVTRNAKYLRLAKFFLGLRGDSTTHTLYGEYSQDHLPVTQQTEAVGHAVRALYMYAGMTDVAAFLGDTEYLNAVNKIWHNVVGRKMYITGGLGSKRNGEAFGGNYELPNLSAYNETCAAIGSVYWNHRLFLLSGQSQYYDIIERTLYNGLISGISLDGKNFFYPNPTESDGQNKFNMGSSTRQPWFDCSCCPTNLIRFIPSLPGLVYATEGNNLYVNLFIANRAQIILNGKRIQVTEHTNYPWDGRISLSVTPESKSKFVLKLRIPGWAQNKPVPSDLYSYRERSAGNVTLTVNGKEEPLRVKEGYAEISRDWTEGDRVELVLPMSIREVMANEKVTEDRNKVAFEFGPIVYCAEEIDNEKISSISIPSDMKLRVEKESVLHEDIVALKGKAGTEDLRLVPYYVWSNRGVGKMRVWFPKADK